MNNIEESIKISKDTRFAVLGRNIADSAIAGRKIHALICEAATLRRGEQDSANRETQFSALCRQVGDADRAGRETAALVESLIALRRKELGPAHQS